MGLLGWCEPEEEEGGPTFFRTPKLGLRRSGHREGGRRLTVALGWTEPVEEEGGHKSRRRRRKIDVHLRGKLERRYRRRPRVGSRSPWRGRRCAVEPGRDGRASRE
ncbi:unnamed protein product [Musa banksii]